jgi:ribosomal protein L32E
MVETSREALRLLNATVIMNWGVYTSQSEEIVRKQRKRMKDLGQQEWRRKRGTPSRARFAFWRDSLTNSGF